MKVKVYGASDDLVEIEGDISEEFGCYDIEKGALAFSDGTLLEVRYDGCWRFAIMMRGSATLTKVEAEGADKTQYSDIVTLEGDALRWVVFSRQGNVGLPAARQDGAR